MRTCPVCLTPVETTMRHNIAGHLDTAGRPCPMTGHPYTHAYTTQQQKETA